MLQNIKEDFTYLEFYTNGENFVRDIAATVTLSVSNKKVEDGSGNIVRDSLPSVYDNWKLVYPPVDRSKFTSVDNWDQLTPEEYNAITTEQLSRITDTAIIKCTTIPKDLDTKGDNKFYYDPDVDAATTTCYLEIYMPPYLTDSESDDPFLQRQGKVPRVVDRKGYTKDKYNTKVLRNYTHAFFRLFDHINENNTGPADNIYDPVSQEVIKWNSRTSQWCKLSWYTDFEDLVNAQLEGNNARGLLDGVIRMPVEAGLSPQTKIKLWINYNANRLVLACMGSPNVDFSNERYLISCAYIGAIDSFDFSINDTAGNFGIFTTSSSVPSIGTTTVNTRPTRQYGVQVMTTNGIGQTIPYTKVPVDSAPKRHYAGDNTLPCIDLGQIPKDINYKLMPKFEFDLPRPLDVPEDSEIKGGGEYFGKTYVDPDTVKLSLNWSQYYNAMTVVDGRAYSTVHGWWGEYYEQYNSQFTGFEVKVDDDDRKKVKVIIDTKLLLEQMLASINFSSSNEIIEMGDMTTPLSIRASFGIYTEYTTQEGGAVRDKYGNIIKVLYRNIYGKNTATGVTDMAMLHTSNKDYFQKHNLMFASTEEFMPKELYGKSIYTGEYFADTIKVVHGFEGPRGILKGMITIDNSSLYAFDELIVNKDFKKHADEPEELYVYLPITAPYCPFSNSPNGQHGIGILKEIRYANPETDAEMVDFAVREIKQQYKDLKYVVEDIPLVDSSLYGTTVTWSSSDSTLLDVGGTTE